MSIDVDASTISSNKTISIHSRTTHHPTAPNEEILDASDIKRATSSPFHDTQEHYCTISPTVEAEAEAKATLATRLSRFIRVLIRGPTSSVDDPLNFSPRKKTMIVLIIAAASFMSPMGTNIYYPSITSMEHELDTTDTAMNATISVFVFCLAFFPLMWASFSDLIGRRPIYLMSYLIFIGGNICCAVSVNIVMLIVFRAVAALGAAAVMSLGSGTIGDIYEPHQRGAGMSYHTLGVLLGTALGPLFGGFLNEGFGWRGAFWFLVIMSSCVWVIILLFLPETHRKASLAIPKDPSLPRTTTLTELSSEKKKKRKMINPVAALGLMLDIRVTLVVIFGAIVFFIFYLVNTNFTRIYTDQYSLNSGMVGLGYLPMAAGNAVGSVIGGRASDRVYTRRVGKREAEGHKAYPELRLHLPMFYAAHFLQLCALTAYGWCIQKDVHFAYGLVCLFFAGVGLMLPTVPVSAYLIDCFRSRAASVMACVNMGRFAMSGIGSLVSSDIEQALGAGILYTFCGALMVVFSVLNVYVVYRGRRQAKKQEQ
ncbi:major facilitator superfamily domain-containing protein [Syncephalastrum racemosum]|uniref:Major facilitator superfamily domain-containing protein n=1 Tax=Syncephalastrum racemosum TaxID=13706 RepID=A0A1X2H0N7_SYNRA|nr:major facilitator superfamily domain-containing protein [Syncephalastrum racemosum]